MLNQESQYQKLHTVSDVLKRLQSATRPNLQFLHDSCNDKETGIKIATGLVRLMQKDLQTEENVQLLNDYAECADGLVEAFKHLNNLGMKNSEESPFIRQWAQYADDLAELLNNDEDSEILDPEEFDCIMRALDEELKKRELM